MFESLNPLVVLREEAPPKSRIKGSKTFYYLAQHVDGPTKPGGDWEGEFNWVPRGYLNKYVSKPVFDTFVGALQI